MSSLWGAQKAPRPDGFNGLFFQKHWETIKDDVIGLVNYFFENGTLEADLNSTLVALVPKVDVPEAYDRLEWGFLEAVLMKYGFSQVWVNRVMKLVNTVSYQYQVNGFRTRKLTPTRGLRQGDPISPYLFMLAFDSLSRMLTKAQEERRFLGLKLAVMLLH